MAEDNKALTNLLEWVVAIDPPAIIASVKAERRKYPNASNRKLAEKGFSSARWKAASFGVVTGLSGVKGVGEQMTEVTTTTRKWVY